MNATNPNPNQNIFVDFIFECLIKFFLKSVFCNCAFIISNILATALVPSLTSLFTYVSHASTFINKCHNHCYETVDIVQYHLS